MIKYTKTIRRQFADELFKCAWPFCDIGTQRVKWLNGAEAQPFIYGNFSDEALTNDVTSSLRKCSVTYIRLLGGINPFRANVSSYFNTFHYYIPNLAAIFLYKVDNGNTMCEMC